MDFHGWVTFGSLKWPCMATTTSQVNGLIGWVRENNRATRAARFLVQFFDVVYQTTTWNLHIWGFSNRARRSKLFILCLYVETIRAKQATLSLSCTKWPTRNNLKTFNPAQSCICCSSSIHCKALFVAEAVVAHEIPESLSKRRFWGIEKQISSGHLAC